MKFVLVSTLTSSMQLFINHRLVDSSSLKRALEMVYSAYLPKGSDLSSHDFSRSASTILSVSPWYVR